MNDKQFLRIELAKAGLTQQELADRLGISSSSLTQKLNRNTLKIEDYQRIAEALGKRFEYAFVEDK